MYKRILFLTIVSIIFLLVSCEEDNPNKPSEGDGVILSGNTVIVNDEDIVNSVIEVNDNEIVVDYNSIFAEYSVGEIMVCLLYTSDAADE